MEQSILKDDVVLSSPAKGMPALQMLFAGGVIVAALYYGQELTVPLVLASLLAFVLAPACRLLQKLRIPRVLAVLVVVLVAFGAIGGLGLVVGRQATSLAASLPQYKSTILTKWNALASGIGSIEQMTKNIGAPAGAAPKADAKPGQGTAAALGLNEISGLTLARNVAQPLLAPLATGAVVLIFTFFILLSNEDLRDRLVRLVGRQDLHRTILAMNDAARRLSRYFLFQLGLNASFGAIIGLALWGLGLPNPLLWAILAAVMRFVPFIGVIIAVVPPLLLAIAVVPGWTLALLVLALFAGTEMLMGQVIEPLIYGHSTGLSPLAVIVATAFWALIWGPVGLLIATPLTVCLVVIGRHVEALAFFDVILGDAPPLEPAETFYQRALEGRAVELLPDARKQIAATSLTDFYDNVALPGIALAQGDLVRDTSAFERLEFVHDQIEQFLARLDVDPRPPAAEAPSDPGDPARRWGDIVCIPGRGQLDDLAATMAAQALNGAKFAAEIVPNAVLGAGRQKQDHSAHTKLCVLSILEQGSTVSGVQYFIRRVQKQMPNATIVVGLWHADRTSPLLAALRADGEEEHLVLSIGELLAFCRALAARLPQAAA